MEKRTKQFDFKKLGAEEVGGGVFTLATIIPALFSMAVLFLLVLFNLAKGDYTAKDWYLYVSYSITPVAFCCIAVFAFKKTSIKPTEFLKKCNPVYFLLVILLQFGLFSLNTANAWFLEKLQRIFSYESSDIVIPSLDGGGIVGAIFVIAFLPALFEELIFRGFLLNGLKRYGKTYAVLMCGLLFALYHKRPEQTVYQFVCGTAFALVAYESGSIFPTFVSHFLNNAVVLLMTKFGLDFSVILTPVGTTLSVLCLLGTLTVLVLINHKSQGEKPKKSAFWIYAVTGLTVCIVTWITTLIAGIF